MEVAADKDHRETKPKAKKTTRLTAQPIVEPPPNAKSAARARVAADMGHQGYVSGLRLKLGLKLRVMTRLKLKVKLRVVKLRVVLRVELVKYRC